MFLRGVLLVFDMVDVPRIHQGSYISIFKSLPSWEVLHLLSTDIFKIETSHTHTPFWLFNRDIDLSTFFRLKVG